MTDTEYTQEQTKHIIELYKKSRIRDKAKYQTNKLKEGFLETNRARAKAHYLANKEIKADKYQNNKQLLKAKALYNYYKNNEKLETFKIKHVEKFNLLSAQGLISCDGTNGSGSGSGSVVVVFD